MFNIPFLHQRAPVQENESEIIEPDLKTYNKYDISYFATVFGQRHILSTNHINPIVSKKVFPKTSEEFDLTEVNNLDNIKLENCELNIESVFVPKSAGFYGKYLFKIKLQSTVSNEINYIYGYSVLNFSQNNQNSNSISYKIKIPFQGKDYEYSYDMSSPNSSGVLKPVEVEKIDIAA